MRRDIHLDISEIAAFGTGPRSEQCDETLRHLLKCRDCRNLLPMPTAKEFWRSVLEDRARSQAEERTDSPLSRIVSLSQGFGRLDAFLRPTRSGAFAVMLFLAVAGFSMLLMFGPPDQTGEDTVSQVKDTYIPAYRSEETPVTSNVEGPTNADTGAESRVEISKSSRLSRERQVESKRSVVISGKRKSRLPVNSAIKSMKRSETRGSGTSCGENSTVGFVIDSTGSGPRLHWGKVPGANSYTVYLSDLDERLIDQFETESATSYVSSAKLEPETTYKWKLVVSLKGGRTILATSQNFRPVDLQENKRGTSITLRKKRAASVRCSEDKQ